LAQIVAALRDSLYPALAQVANRWNEALGIDLTYPSTHAAYLRRCHADGQSKPTPLVLRYGPGDFNCLHQDIYGENIFPLQVAFLLSEPGRDFAGGEFVLTEQRPRMQSRAEVVPLRQGEGVIFFRSTTVRFAAPAAGTHSASFSTMPRDGGIAAGTTTSALLFLSAPAPAAS